MPYYDSDDLEYIKRVLEGLSLTAPVSSDNSIRALVFIKKPVEIASTKMIGIGFCSYWPKVGKWIFESGTLPAEAYGQEPLSYGELKSRFFTTAGRKYILELKENIDYIGTTLGLHMHVNITNPGTGEVQGFVSNKSGRAQFYDQV